MIRPASNTEAPPKDRLSRFSDRAAAYVKHRPSYPAAAIDAVFDGTGDPSALRVLDVGAGTGISSRLLADRGASVIALEPNEAMQRAGESEPHPLVEWRCGTGEATGLADGAVEIVACFQAFHWLDRAKALAEFRRVLKAGGRVALAWNVQDAGDPFTEGYQRVILKHATDPPTSPWLQGFGDVAAALRSEWRSYRELRFANEQSLDLAGLIGRAKSASYCPNAGSPAEALDSDLANLHAAHQNAGRVVLRYSCVVHLAET